MEFKIAVMSNLTIYDTFFISRLSSIRRYRGQRAPVLVRQHNLCSPPAKKIRGLGPGGNQRGCVLRKGKGVGPERN